jgi:hypothetical protein
MQIDPMVERKLAGPEQSVLKDEDFEFHRNEYERLRGVLEEAFGASKLPEIATAKPELHDLLLRLRRI